MDLAAARARFEGIRAKAARAPASAAAMATFGAAGIPLAVPILGFWAYIFFSRSRPRALARTAR